MPRSVSLAWPRRLRRLNRELQFEEVRRRGLHFPHPGLRRARRGEILGLHLDALAALLLRIDAHLVGFFVRRRLALLLLPSLFLLGFQRSFYNRLVALGGFVVWLNREHVVVGLDRLFVGV